MHGWHVGAGRLAIGLSPRPTRPTLPTRTKFKSATLFFSARDGARGMRVALKLPDRDFGSVNREVGQSHFVTHLSACDASEQQEAKQCVFHNLSSDRAA
jgi:hypothetical protein